jgi:CMP-N-acetylneuraminate monooxygenase
LSTSKDFSFATDPWIEGFAFSAGWWTSQFPPKNWQDELNKVDFIYISHNHPDHLNRFTLEKVRKDMHFIVPKFANNSVRKLLNRFGFDNVSSFDFTQYYKFEETDLFFTILKSGDFREDSGFYFSYGNFSCLSTVDSNNLNFLKFPENISLFCSSFAGGASGYPLCFDTNDEQKKQQIISSQSFMHYQFTFCL